MVIFTDARGYPVDQNAKCGPQRDQTYWRQGWIKMGRPIMSGLGRAFGSDIWIHQLVFMMSGPSKHQQIQQFLCEHVPFRLWPGCGTVEVGNTTGITEKKHTWHVIWKCWTCRSEVPRRTWSVHNVLELISTRGKWEHPDPSGCSRVSHCRDQLQTHCDSSLKPRAKHVMVWISVDVGGFSESGTAQNRVIAGRASRRQWKCVRPSCINKRDRSWHLHMKLWVESGSLEAGHLVQKCNWIDGKEGRNLTGFQTVPRLLYFF